MAYYVYILTNPAGNVLYTGVTNDLVRRVTEHRDKVKDGFISSFPVAPAGHDRLLRRRSGDWTRNDCTGAAVRGNAGNN